MGRNLIFKPWLAQELFPTQADQSVQLEDTWQSMPRTAALAVAATEGVPNAVAATDGVPKAVAATDGVPKAVAATDGL